MRFRASSTIGGFRATGLGKTLMWSKKNPKPKNLSYNSKKATINLRLFLHPKPQKTMGQKSWKGGGGFGVNVGAGQSAPVF